MYGQVIVICGCCCYGCMFGACLQCRTDVYDVNVGSSAYGLLKYSPGFVSVLHAHGSFVFVYAM